VADERGATVPLRIPASMHAALLDLARQYRATLFMVVHAALALLLRRLAS
jgi:hypothetical protein